MGRIWARILLVVVGLLCFLFVLVWKGPVPGLRSQVIEILWRKKVDAAIPFIAGCLDDRDARVRREALVAMGMFKDADYAPAVAVLLEDPDPRCRDLAVWACGTMRGRKALPHAVRMLDSPDSASRVIGLQVVGELGDPTHASLIRARLRDKDPWVRGAAVKAMAGLLGKSAVPDLAACLEDPEDSVRLITLSSLRKLSGGQWRETGEARAWWKEHQADPEFAVAP